MLGWLVIAGMGVAAWKLAAPTQRFASGFATLLERPEHVSPGLVSQVFGSRSVGGEHQGRPVTLVVHPKRNKSFGYLIVGVAAASPWSWAIKRRLLAQGWRSFIGKEDGRPRDLAAELAIDGADTKMRAWMADAEVERSIRALTLEHGVDLALESGWLRAKWMPIGAFIFPGSFDERKWREVLAHMRTLAMSLEAAGAGA